MHYVKQFNINGVDTKQVACIELRGKPNAATEGYVGVLGIDILSPLHEVYKCTSVNGSIYSWELLSSGTCVMTSIITGAGEELFEFPYEKLRTVANYIVKVGDVIIDKEGFLYQVESINTTYCIARYNGTQIVSGLPKVGEVDNGKILSVVDGCHAFVDVGESSVGEYIDERLQPVLVAEGRWVSPDEGQSRLISTTNFLKPNTRYLVNVGGLLKEGFSNSDGSALLFYYIEMAMGRMFIYWVEIDWATHYVDGKATTGLFYTVYETASLEGENPTYVQPGIVLTQIIECEQISV